MFFKLKFFPGFQTTIPVSNSSVSKVTRSRMVVQKRSASCSPTTRTVVRKRSASCCPRLASTLTQRFVQHLHGLIFILVLGCGLGGHWIVVCVLQSLVLGPRNLRTTWGILCIALNVSKFLGVTITISST